MATNIYPPILNGTQPAFISTRSSYPIYFTLPQTMSLNSVGHIQIRVVKQTNNQSIVNTSSYPDGIIYKNKISIAEGINDYSISILRIELNQNWEPGSLYKIQLRFGVNEIFTSLQDFTSWKKTQIEQGAFSEWSTVMIIKAIDEPKITIKNAGSVNKNNIITYSEKSETSLTPLFYGSYEISSVNKEYIDKYKFDLYYNDKLIETSGWLQHKANNIPIDSGDIIQSVDTYRFKTVLINGQSYDVNYTVETVNKYQGSPKYLYSFLVMQNYANKLHGIKLKAIDDDIDCLENGYIKLYLQSEVGKLNGKFVLTRSSESSNFTVWEELQHFSIFEENDYNKLLYIDYTIESGVKYKYAFQQEFGGGVRTAPLYELKSPFRMVNFQNSYLFLQGVQLKLEFDTKISSFKHTVLSAKQDTLGSKYPSIIRNGNAYYAEFPISGLISFHMDEEETFFTKKDDGYYYKNKIQIPSDKYVDEEDNIIFNTNLTDNNIFIERRFREKVEEFLNDGGYKLFKSPTEGNFIITLTNVSLSPREELGRMIYGFSATAFEVMENTLENLFKYKILLNDFNKEKNEINKIDTFGQINGLFIGHYKIEADEEGNKQIITNSEPDNLVNKIKQAVEYEISTEYEYKFKKIKAIRIEQYPRIDFKVEIHELEAEYAKLKNEGLSTKHIEDKLLEYKKLTNFINSESDYNITTLEINTKEISIGKNKIYELDSISEEIQSIQLKYSGAIVLDYVCEVEKINKGSGVNEFSSAETSRIWGQVAGIFTNDKNIIKKEKTPDKNYNTYSTTDLLEIIKNEAKMQVETLYNTIFTNYNKDTQMWDDGKVFYSFIDLDFIEIEADRLVTLLIKSPEDDQPKKVIIGPTQKYILKPSMELITSLEFEKSAYAIVNYQCFTLQMEKRKIGVL